MLAPTSWLLLPALLALQGPRLVVRVLGGGAEGGARLVVDRSAGGSPRALVFHGLPAGAAAAMIVSWRRTAVALPSAGGTLVADPTAAGAAVLPVAGRMPLGEMTTYLGNRPLLLQGVVFDVTAIRLTDAVAVSYATAPAPLRSRADRFPAFEPGGRILVLAHKGRSGRAPENTVAAIRAAFEAGADHVEADVRLTKDGIAILMHDWTVDRTTDGTGWVAELTAAEVGRLDAGGGRRVPTLAAALRAARGRGRLLLDVKENGAAPAIGRALAEAGAAPDAIWVYVYASRIALRAFHDELPATPVVWGLVPAVSDDAFFDDLRRLGVVGFDVDWRRLRPDFVAGAHRHGMFVFTYTVNDRGALERALRCRADGIETDVPTEVRRLLRARSGAPRWPWIAGAILVALGLIYRAARARSVPAPSSRAGGRATGSRPGAGPG